MSEIKIRSSASLPTDVYLYGTCIVDAGFADAGMDAVQVLESYGLRVHYPMEQSCCGQPAFTSGVLEQARSVARHQLSLFPENWPIVVLSGSCTGMFRHHYTELFEKQEADYALAVSVSKRAIEFTEFLVQLPPLPTSNQKAVSLVVHTACSAQRETDTLKATENLLTDMGNVDVRQADHGSECCGFGGSFSVRFPNISGKMVDDKCQALTDTKAEYLVSSDCACLMNINGRLAKRGDGMKGKHIATFIKENCLSETNHD